MSSGRMVSVRVWNIIKRVGLDAERVFMGSDRGSVARELGTPNIVGVLDIPRDVLREWDPTVGYGLVCLAPAWSPGGPLVRKSPINFHRFGDRAPIRVPVVWVATTPDGIPCSIDEPIATYLLAMMKQHAPMNDLAVAAS